MRTMKKLLEVLIINITIDFSFKDIFEFSI